MQIDYILILKIKMQFIRDVLKDMNMIIIFKMRNRSNNKWIKKKNVIIYFNLE